MRPWTGKVIDSENLQINSWTAGAEEIRSEALASRSAVRQVQRNSNLRIIDLGEMYLFSLIPLPFARFAVTVYTNYLLLSYQNTTTPLSICKVSQ